LPIEEFFIDPEELIIEDEPILAWVPVQVALGWLWKENPKEHDVGSLVISLSRYGYQDLVVFDANLHRIAQSGEDEPQGAVKSGNGRIYTLALMERQKMTMPRGLAQHKETNVWFMKLVFGVDALNTSEAKAYAFDANNTPLAGGNLTEFDAAQMYSANYVDVLSSLDELPVTVDSETMELLLKGFDELEEDVEEDGIGVDDLELPEKEKKTIECPECGHEWEA